MGLSYNAKLHVLKFYIKLRKFFWSQMSLNSLLCHGKGIFGMNILEDEIRKEKMRKSRKTGEVCWWFTRVYPQTYPGLGHFEPERQF